MKTKLKNIIRWPSTKENDWLPWYRIAWNTCCLPLGIVGVLTLICYNFAIGNWEEVKELWVDYF